MTNFFNPNGYIQPRKVSVTNLEGLFASLMHLISMSEAPYKQELTGIVGIVFNRIQYQYNMDPVGCISLLKLVVRWYIEFIRNGDVINHGLTDEHWSIDHACPEILVGLPSIYIKWSGKKDVPDMTFFNRIVISLLNCHRIIVLPVLPNHDTITSKAKSQTIMPSPAEIRKALAYLGIKSVDFRAHYASEVKNFKYEILNSQGPNGKSTWTAHLDARAWNLRTKLIAQFKTFLQESNFMSLMNHMLGCIRVPSAEVIPNANPILGRLAYIEEWGGKCRIVAQLDYWTQMALTPLHNTINFFLRGLEQDGTFDQEAIAARVRQWTADPKSEVNSFDLTAATDRLPVAFQRMILTELFNSPTIASAWEWILTGRGYMAKDGEFKYYEVGQPMGARSSFPMLALTHHVIIVIAAFRARENSFESWVVLGDDSTINSKSVSFQYQLLMKELGVPINLMKSITYLPNAISAAEICKRIFVNGIELTAINPKMIAKAIKDGREGANLQNDLIRRGFELSNEQFWLFMAAILDRDNLTQLLKLNMVPTSISGLIKAIKPNTPLANISSWLPGLELTTKDLFELFTYVTAVEGLKRLDAVYRASSDLIDVLRILAASDQNPKAIPQRVRDEWLSRILNDDAKLRLQEVLDGVGPITYNHPLLLAATAEGERLSELLHALNSLDTEMVNRARQGLLDMFRSSVGTIWELGAPPRGQESRAVFLKTLTLLVSMYTKWMKKDDRPSVPSVSYSVVITTISRLWTVYFALGGVCSVNALRSATTRNVLHASETLNNALKSISIVPDVGQDNEDFGPSTLHSKSSAVQENPVTPVRGEEES